MLTSKELISPILSSDAITIAGSDNTFRVYFHTDPGLTRVSTGKSPQTINALTPSASWIQFALAQFDKISNQVDVYFERIFDSSQADIALYHDSEINLGDPDVITYGVAVSNNDLLGRKWTEIFFNSPELNRHSDDFNNYVFNHELAHALGLEHAFDNSDGDFYLSTDPYLSATPEETVMSYRLPEAGIYPTDMTVNDYSALQQIWGTPSSFSNGGIGAPDNLSALSPRKVRRLRSKNGPRRHLFTSNQEEIDILTGSEASEFVDEGIAYEVDPAADQNLYRFYQPSSGIHFYSANEIERDILMNSGNTDFMYEGVAYQVFSPLSVPAGSSSVVRYYDPVTSSHFYTANQEEQNILSQTHPSWIREGVAWYV